MSLFKCEECGCVENTALCRYWETHNTKKRDLCSGCDPKIGKWHNKFDQVKWEKVMR